ncbi:MAG: lipoprotein [Granulosicoccus sp.]
MFRLLTAYLCVFFAVLILAGCGNKGELFLPPDLQLVKELEIANERIIESEEGNTDEAETVKKKSATPATQ